MKITVHVKTGKQKSEILRVSDLVYEVRVKARPVEGAANKEIIKLFADYFDVPKSEIEIVTGDNAKTKIIFVPER